jgi:hypothetical protein
MQSGLATIAVKKNSFLLFVVGCAAMFQEDVMSTDRNEFRECLSSQCAEAFKKWHPDARFSHASNEQKFGG